MKSRRARLVKHTAEIECNTLVTFEPENLFYLTGFWGEAIGILEDGHTTIIAPELEAGRAKEESVDASVVTSERGTALVSDLAKRIKGKKACTDCQNYTTMQSIKKSVPNIKHSTAPFEHSRIIKDAGEIAIMKDAGRIIDEMFELCSMKIKRRQKESELQAALMAYAVQQGMFDTGYKSTLNPLIIAGGPNGALPHAQVTDRRFEDGDLIVVDLTLRYKGYVSDSTRTFGLGHISEQAHDIYNIVQESQRLGLRAVKPDVSCSSVDDACRNYITENNYGKYFIHSTGHGVGLDVHESPAVSRASSTKLSTNMAITVEPGIYIPNKFGVRIEDSVIVGRRPTILHGFTKDLLVL